MTQLPEQFTSYTRRLMGEERFERYLQSFSEEAPVSIRLNPHKGTAPVSGGSPVPWCRHGYYLPQRPNFTMDPLLHAGCYYVQEAASMFLDEVLRQLVPSSSFLAPRWTSALPLAASRRCCVRHCRRTACCTPMSR